MSKKRRNRLIKVRKLGRNRLYFDKEDNGDWERFTQDEMEIATGSRKLEENIASTKRLNSYAGFIEACIEHLKKGNTLSTLNRKVFIKIIAIIFKSEGWEVFTPRKAKNKRLNMLVIKKITLINNIKCVLLIRKRNERYKTGCDIVRALEYIIDETRASKGGIIATGSFTRSAEKQIDEYDGLMFFLDGQMIEKKLWELGRAI
jgi:hypothetical protein